MKTKNALVTESYEIIYKYPIILKVGDTVKIEKRESNPDWLGWVYCIDKNEIAGWVSEKYLSEAGQTAVVIKDYDATELSALEGEKLKVHYEEFGWCWSENANGNIGWIPKKNLKFIEFFNENIESFEIRDVNFSNEVELKMLAKLYVNVPLSWDAKYTFTEDKVQKNYEWLLRNKENLKCLVVIDQIQNQLSFIGIHILEKETRSENCLIRTLWVQEEYRKKGLGSKLKKMGEGWAKSIGVKKIITHVMSNNPSMLEINKSMGFVLTKYEMEKKI